MCVTSVHAHRLCAASSASIHPQLQTHCAVAPHVTPRSAHGAQSLLLPVVQGAGIGDVYVSTGKLHHDRRIPLPGFDKQVRRLPYNQKPSFLGCKVKGTLNCSCSSCCWRGAEAARPNQAVCVAAPSSRAA